MNEGRLYLLQVWPGQGRFHAALRAVDETQVLDFDAVQPLCEHIAGMAATSPPAMPAPMHPGHTAPPVRPALTSTLSSGEAP